jgi:hypothetical protein
MRNRLQAAAEAAGRGALLQSVAQSMSGSRRSKKRVATDETINLNLTLVDPNRIYRVSTQSSLAAVIR